MGNKQGKGAKGEEAQPAASPQEETLKLKILVLGAGESGKSTIIKQLRRIHHQDDISPEEYKHIARALHINVLEAIKSLIDAVTNLDIGWGDDADAKADGDAILAKEKSDDETLLPEDAARVLRLWASEPIQKAFHRRGEFYFPDGGPYYFKHVERFAEPDFVPSSDDLVMARVRTTGMNQTNFEAPPIKWEVVDVGGQRNERKRWANVFKNVDGVVWVVNAAGYNRRLFEDSSKNRLEEAIELFSKITRTVLFKDTPFFLFINKKDLLEEQLKEEGLDVCFPEYEGTDDVVQALDYITKKFSHACAANKHITSHHYLAARYKQDVKTAFANVRSELVEIHAGLKRALSGDPAL